MKKLAVGLCGISACLLLAVLLSLIPSDAWFIRTIDLLREPMSYFAALLLIAVMFMGLRWRGATVFMLALVIVVNMVRIWPYSVLAASQLTLAKSPPVLDDARCFSAMSANVKLDNGQYEMLADQVRQFDPDLLFLMETDDGWIEALEPLLSRYGHVERHPQSEAFGLVFATRLPVLKSNVVENTYRDTPTLYATVRPQGSPPIEFIGLHPKPPLPDWGTEMRDQNIINAGVQTPDRLPDAFVMGDFNDVPWSRTTSKFRDVGEWRDPRIGRGSFPTYPARMGPIGWPLDQLMVKGRLVLRSFDILPYNGSDHRAVFAQLCIPAIG